MKKGLLGSTALVAATALTAGMAQAAEAPTLKISGFMNFQAYFADRDLTTKTTGTFTLFGVTTITDTVNTSDIYFGVDDAEINFNVSGTADNGLEYGFKIELNANTSDGSAADEARIQLGGSWGVIQLGDEDGAEDTMNYGGENVMGAAGGWDGDGDDVYFGAGFFFPTITGDTSDATKITYYTPRFSGFQVGASWTPNYHGGDRSPGDDTLYQNHFGLGANYVQNFGGWDLALSGVYSTAKWEGNTAAAAWEDISAYSLGGVVGFGGFSIGANWTANGDRGPTTTKVEHGYWNVALGFEAGPWYLSAGYIAHQYKDWNGPGQDAEPKATSVTVDYTVAPGLVTYAEWTGYDADNLAGTATKADASVFILGAKVSF